MTQLSLNDEVGTASITPDGDGFQDELTIAFTANLGGIGRLYIDVNNDGLFDPITELALRADVLAGANRLSWDGLLVGQVLPPTGVGEVHVPTTSLELNTGAMTFAVIEVDGTERMMPSIWNDTAVRGEGDLIDATDVLSTVDLMLDPSAFAIPRRWLQLLFPVIFDTWAYAALSTVNRPNDMPDPVDRIRIGGDDESPDKSGILYDDEEDTNGNGMVDDETDPNDPTPTTTVLMMVSKTGWHEPREPDSDMDGLLDGPKKTKGNAIGETDPLDADSDGDGIPDGDPLPLSPIRPDADMPPSPTLDGGLEPLGTFWFQRTTTQAQTVTLGSSSLINSAARVGPTMPATATHSCSVLSSLISLRTGGS